MLRLILHLDVQLGFAAVMKQLRGSVPYNRWRPVESPSDSGALNAPALSLFTDVETDERPREHTEKNSC